MTVSTTTARVQLVYTGEGDYDFLFQVFDPEEDLKVTHVSADGETETELAYNADPGYTATIDQNYNGTVTVADTDTDLGSAGYLRIERETSLTQVVDWLNAGPMNMDTLERCLDKLTMICQELSGRVDSFSMTLRNKGDWAANTDYEVGDLVMYGGVYYLCMADHTSGSSFTSTYWSEFFDPGHTHTSQTAEQTPYDNSVSGLTADDVQAAIDEVAILATGQPENFRGIWDASTTTDPDWANPAAGDYGYISVAGTIDGVAYSIGDKIIYDGADWLRVAGAQQGSAENLLKNAQFRLSGYPTVANDSFPTFEGEVGIGETVHTRTVHRWAPGQFSVVKGSNHNLDDSITIAKSTVYFYIKGMEKYRGHVYQLIPDGGRYAGLAATLQASVSAGSMDVYVIPEDWSDAIRSVADLTTHDAYKIGTLSTTNLALPFTFPALTGDNDCYMVLFVDNMDGIVSWPAVNWSSCCLFKNLMMSLGNSPKQFTPKSVSEYEYECRDSLEYSFEPGATSYNGSIFGVLAKAIANSAYICSVNFKSMKLEAPTVNTYTPATMTAARVNCAGVARAVTSANVGRAGYTITNNSGVTLGDQSYYYYHYHAQVSFI